MDEFSLIRKYFAPLARGFPGSLNLTDDAAVIAVPPGKELVVTTDTISAGVHFIGNESPDLIARKLLRVNLSDLAAMGAQPLCYFLNLSLPRSAATENWFKDFTKGLAADQKTFDIHLAGGDTTVSKGVLTLSVTALGLVEKGRALTRGGARPGDNIYVSGTIGDGALGLRHKELARRYLLPEPRVALGQKLIGIARACIDVSDGLVQDLGHICTESKLAAVIHWSFVPLSSPAKKLVKKNPALWETILGGGDDYELLFTAPPAKAGKIAALSKALKLPLAKIGVMTKDGGVAVLDEAGKKLAVKKKGFRHF